MRNGKRTLRRVRGRNRSRVRNRRFTRTAQIPPYIAAIGYVNRIDLLQRAIASTTSFHPHRVVIDNSPDHDLQRVALDAQVLEPSVPLSFSQTMNLLFRLAEERGCEMAIFMHNDAEAAGAAASRLLSTVAALKRKGRRWGAVFTNYQALVAFNMEAVRAVGDWDAELPHYFSDNDYYRRLHLAGYPLIESRLPVTHHHGGSSTIKSDDRLRKLNDVTFPLYQSYYEAKWGGVPGHERFLVPFQEI